MRGGNKLYVPVENIELLSRYGSESEGVTPRQPRRRSLAAAQVADEGADPRDCGRAHQDRGACAPRAPASIASPDASYPQFVDRFPYEETDDQDRAIEDVLADLEAGKPMDRLVCGDVGFGKTEVALRAAFVMAMSGKQVALVCPTTLLARQHYPEFRRAACRASRSTSGACRGWCPAAEAKKTKEGIAGRHGRHRHRHPRDAREEHQTSSGLGLVIVDEEQHFGVAHKERLKALKADVHVLTLTATPIPRTLQMAMCGLARPLSVIQTPPVDRLAVRTYVTPWDGVVLREALLREHYRGGQSFFVVPRVADLPDIEEWLREQVPGSELRHRSRPDERRPRSKSG